MTEQETLHWHCNKRWTDVGKTKDALGILMSKDFEGKTWSEGKQALYGIQLKKRGLSDSTNPRSTRAILGTFKFFGFAWTLNRKLLITEAGKEFVEGNSTKILALQLLKWQYPNPFESKGGVAPYTRTLRLLPFRVLLGLLCDIGPLHEDELALFVWKVKNDTNEEIGHARENILNYRQRDEGHKRQLMERDSLYITNHEYEAHLRPYILATNLCYFDPDERTLGITERNMEKVRKILSEKVNVRIEWKDEAEWFEYYGNTKYFHPPEEIRIRLKPKSGVARGYCIKVTQNGRESFGLSDEDGIAIFSLFRGQELRLEVMRPTDGSTVFQSTRRIQVTTVDVPLKEKLRAVKESLDEILEKMKQLLLKGLDNEMKERLAIREKLAGETADRRVMRYLRGARFEQLTYRLMYNFKTKVFDDVVWNGKVGEWGLPTPAQKVSEQTGKKLPDIIAFENNNIYVVETTLLRGRAQWEKPEAVSVPDHIESMIATSKDRKVCGLFVAEKLDQSVEINLVTRAVNKGYQVVPMEAEEFLQAIKLLAKNPEKDFWVSYYNQLWAIHKRNATRKEREI